LGSIAEYSGSQRLADNRGDQLTDSLVARHPAPRGGALSPIHKREVDYEAQTLDGPYVPGRDVQCQPKRRKGGKPELVPGRHCLQQSLGLPRGVHAV
jgi:hypothetical protein